jgi:hypothetical protein
LLAGEVTDGTTVRVDVREDAEGGRQLSVAPAA